jgi:hypothetical protein
MYKYFLNAPFAALYTKLEFICLILDHYHFLLRIHISTKLTAPHSASLSLGNVYRSLKWRNNPTKAEWSTVVKKWISARVLNYEWCKRPARFDNKVPRRSRCTYEPDGFAYVRFKPCTMYFHFSHWEIPSCSKLLKVLYFISTI